MAMDIAFHQAAPTLLEAGGGFAIIALLVAGVVSLFTKN
jgi:hypothetical protein